ncbi:fimbrillin family protein [Bacteroides nordii]|uniref:Fimbrillin family protein n=1 Tax=Bacteroides nordii TaxID=291645 RepID=A0A413VIG6_9BACE|nr:fimbrillin family protein [Bacteroides nordii]RHB33367.1 fimbrillin family protein [Bacteroides nordii]
MIYKCKTGRFQTICFLLLTTAFFSCSQEEPVRSGGDRGAETLIPLRVGSAGKGGIVTRAEGDTKLLEQATDRIGLFLMADETNGYQAVSNKPYTYSTPYWQSKGQLMLAKEPARLAAYYPYDANGTNPALLVSRIYDADKEFYYLPFSASYITSTVHLNLRRAYALLRFNFIIGTGEENKGAYTGDGKITAFSFTAPLLQAGTLNLFTGKVNEAVQAQATLNYGTSFTAGNAAAPSSVDFMVVPSDMAAYTDMTFALTADGKEMKNGKLALVSLCGSEKKLLEGTKYEINVTLRPTGLEVEGLKVQDWETDDISDVLQNK